MGPCAHASFSGRRSMFHSGNSLVRVPLTFIESKPTLNFSESEGTSCHWHMASLTTKCPKLPPGMLGKLNQLLWEWRLNLSQSFVPESVSNVRSKSRNVSGNKRSSVLCRHVEFRHSPSSWMAGANPRECGGNSGQGLKATAWRNELHNWAGVIQDGGLAGCRHTQAKSATATTSSTFLPSGSLPFAST